MVILVDAVAGAFAEQLDEPEEVERIEGQGRAGRRRVVGRRGRPRGDLAYAVRAMVSVSVVFAALPASVLAA